MVYDRKWVTFCTWCTERQIDPVSISIGNLGDFLLHLYESQNLAASTLRAYKAVILSALALRQIFTPAQLLILNKLCNVFHKRGLLNSSLISTWDIGLVLRALSLALFEPLETASLEAITYKTLVLIALALGAPRGELCALRRVQFLRPAEDWFPLFIPKTGKGRLPTKPYKLRALPPSTPPPTG